MKYWFIAFMFLAIVAIFASLIRTDYMQYVATICGFLCLGFAALIAALAEINDSIKDKQKP